jgi:hypothetical protein
MKRPDGPIHIAKLTNLCIALNFVHDLQGLFRNPGAIPPPPGNAAMKIL